MAHRIFKISVLPGSEQSFKDESDPMQPTDFVAHEVQLDSSAEKMYGIIDRINALSTRYTDENLKSPTGVVLSPDQYKAISTWASSMADNPVLPTRIDLGGGVLEIVVVNSFLVDPIVFGPADRDFLKICQKSISNRG